MSEFKKCEWVVWKKLIIINWWYLCVFIVKYVMEIKVIFDILWDMLWNN